MAADASVRVDTSVDNSNLLKLQRDFDKLEEKLKRLHEKGEKLEELGVDKQSKQWRSLMYDVAQTEMKLDDVRETIQELSGLNCIDDVDNGFKNVSNSARKCFDNIRKGTKSSNSLLKTFASRLNGIALSLLIFNWITKAFNALVSSIKQGFQNIVQSSKEYNQAMSNLKSSSAQMKNALASAFEPIATAIIPYIIRLVDWITIAADKMAQFMAVISGRDYYNKAKKQVIDYAKSLNSASKSAKGALAAFDQLNVLSKPESGGGTAGGELTGEDAYEKVYLDQESIEQFQKLKDILMEILGVATLIGFVFAGWKIISFMTSIGPLSYWLLLIVGAVTAIYFFLDMWENGVDWGSLIGYIAGVAAMVVAILVLFGPVAAGIALIVAGIAGLVLAIKDISENGLNAKNGMLLLISAVGILIGVLIAFGAPAALVVGIIMVIIGVISALVIAGGNGEEVLMHLREAFRSLGEFVTKIFAGDFEGALESLKECGRSFGNFFISVAEGIANGFIKMVNAVIDAINSMLPDSFPDWVPVIGGKDFPKIPNWGANVNLPRLADGAVIPGGRPFAAILGDQRSGQTNIETPLSTMVDAFKQAMAETGGSAGGSYTFVAEIDGREVFRETVRQDQMYRDTHGGVSAFAD